MEIKAIPNNEWTISLPFFDQTIQFIKYDDNNNIYIFYKNCAGIYKSKFNNYKITFTKITNSESINKIKFIDIQSTYFIILTELNEFILYYENEFIKLNILFNKIIKYFNTTNDLHIVTKDHELYIVNNFSPKQSLNLEKLQPIKVNNLFVKEISGFTHVILLDIFGNIYVKGENRFGELGLKDEIKPTFYFSFSSSTFISDNKNNIYISGGTDFRDFGISLKDSDCLLEFTKIDLKLNSKYINILPLDNVKIFIGTDYKINNENEENILGEKCFKVLQNKKLIDLFIYCDNNYKKRKRNEIYL
ncbi:hypothetical protein ABK040_009027 [Willaertia magna]